MLKCAPKTRNSQLKYAHPLPPQKFHTCHHLKTPHLHNPLLQIRPSFTNMRHHLLRLTMAPSSSSLSRTTTNRKPSSNPNFTPNPNHSNSYTNCSNCTHSPSATLDILILILVLFSGAFLISSYFSYIFHSLSLILPPLSVSASTVTSLIADSSAAVYLVGFLIFFVVSIIGFEICCGNRSRKCGKKGCKGLKKAMEFDLQLQTEEILRSGGKGVKEMEELPWKGGSETNPDYECLRSELRKMAPPNGRAVLLFRMKCGCPVAKLEGWGPKPRRRNKKSLALNGGGGGDDR